MVKLWKIGWNRIEKFGMGKIQNRLENKYEKLKQVNTDSKYMFSFFDRNSVTCC